jgi:hypothetical protein
MSVVARKYVNTTFAVYSADYGTEYVFLSPDGQFVAWKSHKQSLYRGRWELRESYPARLSPPPANKCSSHRIIRLCFNVGGRPMRYFGGPYENPFEVLPRDAGCVAYSGSNFYEMDRAAGDALGMMQMLRPPISLPPARLLISQVRQVIHKK